MAPFHVPDCPKTNTPPDEPCVCEHWDLPRDTPEGRRPLTDDDIREGVDAARRYLERATSDTVVETQRLIVALADRAGVTEAALKSALVTMGEVLDQVGAERDRLRASLLSGDEAARLRDALDVADHEGQVKNGDVAVLEAALARVTRP